MSFPHLTIANFDGKYSIPCRHGEIHFDCERGAGAAPNNANIRYAGFGAMMRPSRFLEMALPLTDDRVGSLAHFSEPKTVFGPPTLYLALDKKIPRVVGHEGRHRTRSILQRCGDERLLVHVVPADFRARDMDLGRLLDMRKNARAEDGKRVLHDNFNVAFVEDRAINMLDPDPFEVLVWSVRAVAETAKIRAARDDWQRRVATVLKEHGPLAITPDMIKAALRSLNIYVYGS